MEKRILAVDPGNQESGWVLYRGGQVEEAGVDPNAEILRLIKSPVFDVLLLEEIQSFGKAVGRSVFETCRWIGRFEEAYSHRTGLEAELLGRVEVKKRLCGKVTRGDKEVRRSLILRFGATDEAAIGTKANPGPLHRVKSHAWSALALAVVWSDTQRVSSILQGVGR